MIEIKANQKTPTPLLFTSYRSSCAWRVRIALAYKKIRYETNSIKLFEREQYARKYLEINPMGQVPALYLKGKMITQSSAILELIEEIFPEYPLLPKDVHLRSKVREICEVIGSGIQPLQNFSVVLMHSRVSNERLRWAQFWIKKGLSALEKILCESSTNGRYCVGNELTMADCFLVPQVGNTERYEVDISNYPTIANIYSNLSNLDFVRQSHPSIQPDAPSVIGKTWKDFENEINLVNFVPPDQNGNEILLKSKL